MNRGPSDQHRLVDSRSAAADDVAARAEPSRVDAMSAQVMSRARIDPDSVGRMRGLALLGWGFLALSTVVVVGAFLLVVQAEEVADGPESVLIGIGYSFIAAAWLGFGTLFLYSRPAIGRGMRVAVEHRREVVMTAFVGMGAGWDLGDALAKITDSRPPRGRRGIATQATLLIDERGLSFWRGWRHPYEQYLVPWRIIGQVSSAQVELDMGRGPVRRPGIEISLEDRDAHSDARQEGIAFAPTRTNMLMSRPFGAFDKIRSVASEIEARRPPASGAPTTQIPGIPGP